MHKVRSVEKDGLKFCTCCSQWKTIDNFSPERTKKDGTIGRKPVCKACHNEQQKERQKNRTEKVKELKEMQTAATEDIQARNNQGISHTLTELSPEDIKELKELLTVKERLLHLLTQDHNKGIPQGIATAARAEREKRTYNMDPHILTELNQVSKDTGSSQSDIVNAALKQYLAGHKCDKRDSEHE